MQAHLRDLAFPQGSPQSFLICQRVLQQCHELIFGDIPAQSTAPYSSIHFPTQLGPVRRKVRPHIQPALIGIGIVWAGVPGMPRLTEIMGEVAIEQGRIDEQGEDVKSLERADDDVVRGVRAESPAEQVDEKDELEGSDDDEDIQAHPETQLVAAPPSFAAMAISRSKRRQTIAAQTTPALTNHLQGVRRYRLSEDPFSQQDVPSPLPMSSPFQSTPTLSTSRHRTKTMSVHAADLIQQYDFPSQIHLLRSHFCRSEVRRTLSPVQHWLAYQSYTD